MKNSIREIPISKELMKLIRPLKKLMNDDYYVITMKRSQLSHVPID